MRAHADSTPGDIDVTSLWSVIKGSGPKLLGASLLVGGLTYGIASVMPARYTSEAQIRIGTQGTGDPFRDPYASNTNSAESAALKVDKEAVASQVVALRSPDLAGRLVSELKLAELPEFNSAAGAQGILDRIGRMVGLTGPRPGETDDERVMQAYAKALQVSQVKDTRVITITFSAGDSALAATAANRLVELYQELLRAQSLTQNTDAGAWLKPQIEKLTKEVANLDSEVERFRSSANLFRGTNASANLNEQQLAELASEVIKVRTARGDAESRARTARDLLQRNSADAIPEVQKSPVIQALIAQRIRAERDKAEAETSLLSGHPRMKQLNANLADLKRQVTKEAIVIVDGLEKEAKQLALREQIANKNLEEIKASVGNNAGDVARLAGLEGQAKAKRRELETLQSSYEATRSRGDVKAVPVEAQLISTARASSIPTSPKKTQLSLLAAISTLILGFALVITRELLVGGRQSTVAATAAPTATVATTPAPVPAPQPVVPEAVSVIASAEKPEPFAARRSAIQASEAPIMTASAAPPAAISVAPTGPGQKNSIEAVARRLLGNAEAQSGYRSILVGNKPGMDVREEAADLAGALTAAGVHVILVDWSVDGIGLSPALGVNPTPGVMDLLSGRATFEDAIQRLPDGDAHIVPCGAATPSDHMDADRINLVFDALDEAYDHIIVAGRYEPIRDLFLTIQGRFDAAIEVREDSETADVQQAADGEAFSTFLDFEVAEIDIIRLDRATPSRGRRTQTQRARQASAANAPAQSI